MTTVKKASIQVEGMSGMFGIDVIEHEGQHWLVPNWIETPSKGQYKPARLILLESLQYQNIGPSVFGDFAVNNPIPKAVLDGLVQQQQGFAGDMYWILEAPDVIVDRGDNHSH